MAERVCNVCGRTFEGHKRARICPECKKLIFERMAKPEYGVCPICGIDFVPRRQKQKCCSFDCQEEYNLMLNNFRRNGKKGLAPEKGGPIVGIHKKLPKRKKKEPGPDHLTEVNQRARDMGLTYGEYKAKERMGMIDQVDIVENQDTPITEGPEVECISVPQQGAEVQIVEKQPWQQTDPTETIMIDSQIPGHVLQVKLLMDQVEALTDLVKTKEVSKRQYLLGKIDAFSAVLAYLYAGVLHQ